MRALQAACRKLYVIKRKTWYILIHAPYTCVVVFWHISNIPQTISLSQICYDNPMFFCIATNIAMRLL